MVMKLAKNKKVRCANRATILEMINVMRFN